MIAARSLAPALIAIVLTAAWLGAVAIVGAVVAPAAFDVLPSRTLAGALVGRVLPVLFLGGIITAVVSLAITWPLAARAARLGTAVVQCAACVAAQLVIAPKIERIRAAVAGPIDALAVSDPRRVDFGRLHALSVGLLGVAAIAALIGLVLLSRSIPPLHDA